jgi:hypothetical protein
MTLLDLIQPDNLPIDFVVVVLVLFAGEFQKKYMEDWRVSGALKTLFVSFVFTLVYAILFSLSNGFLKSLPVKWFFSYTLATSLYELLFKKIINKFFGNENPQP